MGNVRKVSLTIGHAVLAGLGLFAINVVFTVPAATAMSWNGSIFDAVGWTSERGLLKDVSSRKGVRKRPHDYAGWQITIWQHNIVCRDDDMDGTAR